MANEKKQETAPEKAAQAAEVFNKLATTGTAAMTYEQAFEMLENTPTKYLVSLSQEYFKFPKIGVYSFIAEGLSHVEMQGKNIEVVKLRDKEGTAFINGDKVLVSAVKRLEVLPAFIRVDYTGDKKNATGSYKELEVTTFPVNP